MRTKGKCTSRGISMTTLEEVFMALGEQASLMPWGPTWDLGFRV